MDHLRPQLSYHPLPSSECMPQHPVDSEGVELQRQPQNHTIVTGPVSGDVAEESHTRPLNFRRRYWTQGWCAGVLTAATLIFLSMIVNLIVILWLSQQTRSQNGLPTIYYDDCDKMELTDTLVHLAVNALSAVMLAGGNYTMQVLVGPTRPEIDKAHESGRWLDIGLPSVRNLTMISMKRTALWMVLALSSMPLHLMYNSAFYVALATNDYGILVVTHQVLDSAASSIVQGISDPSPLLEFVQTIQDNAKSYENLSNVDCINAYAHYIISDRTNLVIVSSNSSADDFLLHASSCSTASDLNPDYGIYNDPYGWICTDPSISAYRESHSIESSISGANKCQYYLSFAKEHAADWSPFGFKAEYSLSKKSSTKCSFNANIPIVITVIVCNAIKVIVMVYVVFRLCNDPIIVIGDAVQSFINKPDKTTKQLCLLSQYQAKITYFPGRIWPVSDSVSATRGHAAHSRGQKWRSAVDSNHWYLALLCLSLSFAATIIVLYFASKTLGTKNLTELSRYGFGSINPTTLLPASTFLTDSINLSWSNHPSSQILRSVLLANVPQVISSLLYFYVNGILTAMFAANEWSDFARERKTLRVSNPRGKQRSTYFLQLPYKVAAPLIIFSLLLHWIMSRSFFLVVVIAWLDGEPQYPIALATCGYSPVAILIVTIMVVVLFVTLNVLDSRNYCSFIPLVGGCSAAISAACHVPDAEQDPALKPLQWGVVTNPQIKFDTDLGEVDVVGHCCLSSEEVTLPELGKLYAGLPYSSGCETK